MPEEALTLFTVSDACREFAGQKVGQKVGHAENV